MKTEWIYKKIKGIGIVEILKTYSVDAVENLARGIKKENWEHWMVESIGEDYGWVATVRGIKNIQTGECWFWDGHIANHDWIAQALNIEGEIKGSVFFYAPGKDNEYFNREIGIFIGIGKTFGGPMSNPHDSKIGPKYAMVMKKWFAEKTDKQLREIASNWGTLAAHRSPVYVESLRKLLLAEAVKRGLMVETAVEKKEPKDNREWFDGGRGEKAYRDYMWYLKNRIIPDSIESGNTNMATDLKKLYNLIVTRKYDVKFVKYLAETLLPDIARSNAQSGYIKDFEIGLCFLSRRVSRQNPPQKEIRYALPRRGYGAMVNPLGRREQRWILEQAKADKKFAKVFREGSPVREQYLGRAQKGVEIARTYRDRTEKKPYFEIRENPLSGSARRRLSAEAREHEKDSKRHKALGLKAFDAGTAAGIRECLANPSEGSASLYYYGHYRDLGNSIVEAGRVMLQKFGSPYHNWTDAEVMKNIKGYEAAYWKLRHNGVSFKKYLANPGRKNYKIFYFLDLNKKLGYFKSRRKGTKFDYEISREEATRLLRTHGNNLAFDIMSKEYLEATGNLSDDEDEGLTIGNWVGVNTSDIPFMPELRTFEIAQRV